MSPGKGIRGLADEDGSDGSLVVAGDFVLNAWDLNNQSDVVNLFALFGMPECVKKMELAEKVLHGIAGNYGKAKNEHR